VAKRLGAVRRRFQRTVSTDHTNDWKPRVLLRRGSPLTPFVTYDAILRLIEAGASADLISYAAHLVPPKLPQRPSAHVVRAVLRTDAGEWQVFGGPSEDDVFTNEKDALTAARTTVSKLGGGEILLRRPDGTVKASDVIAEHAV
jgi:hypothetical protein